MDEKSMLLEQLRAQENGRAYALVTLIKAEGSTPRSSGKMLVYTDGSISGTIGGGQAERRAIRDAVACIAKRQNAFLEYDITEENKAHGMLCGGNVSVYIEVCAQKPRLILCGAGHVGGALIPVAKTAGFEVTLLDSRPKEVIQEKIDNADRFIPVEEFGKGIEQLELEPGAFFVIATFGHMHDGEALYAALQKQAAYIGMIGSRSKVGKLFDTLMERGVTAEQLAAVYSPVGLDIGGETPEEVAISIMAEILMVKYGASGRHMREKRDWQPALQ
ncbi:MAG: XdhC/CoxI family protein [Bacillota bacterium]